jgi:uncharacterized protein YndB with AHSA1/START domain
MFQDIRMQLHLAASPAVVWHALTASEAVQSWFAEFTDIDLDAKRYDFWGRWTLFNPNREMGSHKIYEAVLEQSIAYDWHIHGDDTRVTFTLIPEGAGTILLMRHAQAPNGIVAETQNGFEDFWFLSLENLRRYTDGKPSEARIDYSNPMRGNIRHETEIDAPASRVFEVLTNPDEINRWIATAAKVSLEQGGDYCYGWIVDGVDAGAAKILDVVPDHRISAQTPDFGPEYPPSVMTWELEENNGKTRVIFTHSGFADDADVTGIYSGWRAFLNWVRSIAEYGAGWQPPISLLKPDAVAYPKSIILGQSQLLDALKAS